MAQGNYVDTGVLDGLAGWWKNTMNRVNNIDPITNAPYQPQPTPEVDQLRQDVARQAASPTASSPVQVSTSSFAKPMPKMEAPAPVQRSLPMAAPVSALVSEEGRRQIPLAIPNSRTTQPGPKESMITGLSPVELERLVEIESGKHGYDALNKKSGAYGKYQFIPSTAAEYAKRLNIKGDNWKTPENQDRMFQAFTYDNIKELANRGMPTTLFNVYGAHQQGASGFADIMNNKLTPKLERNMRANLPGGEKLKGQELRSAWINYWKDRTTM